MDYKAVKQPVCVNETVFEKSCEVPFDIEFTMPDYCPDIMKILKCRVYPRIASKTVNGNNVSIDGSVTVNVMYSDQSGCIYNYEQISPFSKTLETETDVAAGFICAKVKCEYVNCRAVTERRMDIHGALNLDVNIIIRKKHEIIAEINQDEIQLDRKIIPAQNSVGLAEKSLLIDEESELSSGSEPIEAILQYDAFSVILEAKAIKNKVVVKGELSVNVMYCSKGHSRYHTFKTVVPFSQFLDLDSVGEHCRIEATSELSYLEIRAKKGLDECRNITINAKICVLCRAFCDYQVPVISDAFSTKHDILLHKEQIGLENLVTSLYDTYLYKACFDFPDGSLVDIVNYWCDTRITECSVKDSTLKACVAVTLCLLARDTDNNICYFEKTDEAEYKTEIELKGNTALCCEPVFNAVSSSYTILSDSKLEFRTEYKVALYIKEKRKQQLLIGIEVENGKPKSKAYNCSMVIYYPCESESLWDIAKRYNSDISELKKLNDLQDDTTADRKVLLVPIY